MFSLANCPASTFAGRRFRRSSTRFWFPDLNHLPEPAVRVAGDQRRRCRRVVMPILGRHLSGFIAQNRNDQPRRHCPDDMTGHDAEHRAARLMVPAQFWAGRSMRSSSETAQKVFHHHVLCRNTVGNRDALIPARQFHDRIRGKAGGTKTMLFPRRLARRLPNRVEYR